MENQDTSRSDGPVPDGDLNREGGSKFTVKGLHVEGNVHFHVDSGTYKSCKTTIEGGAYGSLFGDHNIGSHIVSDIHHRSPSTSSPTADGKAEEIRQGTDSPTLDKQPTAPHGPTDSTSTSQLASSNPTSQTAPNGSGGNHEERKEKDKVARQKDVSPTADREARKTRHGTDSPTQASGSQGNNGSPTTTMSVVSEEEKKVFLGLTSTELKIFGGALGVGLIGGGVLMYFYPCWIGSSIKWVLSKFKIESVTRADVEKEIMKRNSLKSRQTSDMLTNVSNFCLDMTKACTEATTEATKALAIDPEPVFEAIRDLNNYCSSSSARNLAGLLSLAAKVNSTVVGLRCPEVGKMISLCAGIIEKLTGANSKVVENVAVANHVIPFWLEAAILLVFALVLAYVLAKVLPGACARIIKKTVQMINFTSSKLTQKA